MAYIGREPQIGNFQVCDAISVVNGQAAYTMQVSSVNVSPETANHMIVSLNGIIQAPGSSYTISGSTITFASNLVTGDVIDFIHILGSVLDLGVPSDSTVSLAKLTATGTKDATTFLRGDNTFAAAGGTNTPAFQATMSGNQDISNSTDTKIQFDTEDFDTDGKYDHSTNYRFTPTVAGKYHVTIRVNYVDAGVVDKGEDVFIFKNGSQVQQHRTRTSGSGTGRDKSTEINGIVTLDTDDYIEAYTRHNIGSTKAIQASGKKCLFQAFKILT